ncbi:hypothetical protein P7C70_g886, partial [Phenoliferia sp. Uapishka_3]
MTSNNPYTPILDSVNQKLYLDASPSFPYQLRALSGVLGIALLLALACLALRVQRRRFWLYRVHSTGAVVPNGLVLWLLWSSLFLARELAFLSPGVSASRAGPLGDTAGGDSKNALEWRLILWLPLWIGGLNMTWATCLAPFLSPTEPDRYTLASQRYLITATFITIHIAVIGTLVPLSIIANARSNEALQQGKALASVLEEASAAFEAGTEASEALQISMETISERVEAVERVFQEMLDGWRATWVAYLILTSLLAILRNSTLSFIETLN